MKKKLSGMDAVFIGGNWNFEYFDKPDKNGVSVRLDPDYLKFLKKEHVEWVGISVGIYQDNVRDDTVERYYPDVKTSEGALGTMTDVNLQYLLKQFEKEGFNVYLTTAFEPKNEQTLEGFTQRRQMGKSYDDEEVSQTYDREDWLWDPSHPGHDEFVHNFWQSYTHEMVHYAKIAEKCGVDLFSLGTETDALFHTKASESSAQTFGTKISSMINSVRKHYEGLLTYDQHSSAVQYNDMFEGRDLWTSTSFDVIGISAYFPLLTEVDGPSSVRTLQQAWRVIFDDTLKPLQEENPHKSIVFTEFGYTDSIMSPVQFDADAGQRHRYRDVNHNGLDDGEETQANIYKAFFNVNREYGELVKGVFPLSAGGHVFSDEEYFQQEHWMTGFHVRGKLAAKVFAREYRQDDSILAGNFTGESDHHHRAVSSNDLQIASSNHEFSSDFLL